MDTSVPMELIRVNPDEDMHLLKSGEKGHLLALLPETSEAADLVSYIKLKLILKPHG